MCADLEQGCEFLTTTDFCITSRRFICKRMRTIFSAARVCVYHTRWKSCISSCWSVLHMALEEGREKIEVGYAFAYVAAVMRPRCHRDTFSWYRCGLFEWHREDQHARGLGGMTSLQKGDVLRHIPYVRANRRFNCQTWVPCGTLELYFVSVLSRVLLRHFPRKIEIETNEMTNCWPNIKVKDQN